MEYQLLHQSSRYLSLGDYQYWTMSDCADIEPETFGGVLNRTLLFKDPRNLIPRRGDTAIREV